MQIACPWEYDSEDILFIKKPEYNWIIEYINNKGFPYDYLRKPKEKQEQHVRTIVESLLGPRHFLLLINKNTSYTWELYYYACIVWAMSKQQGFYILDIAELDLFDQEYKQLLKKIETIPLLVIPYTDPQGYDLRRKRNILGNILAKRKAKKLPFITDMFARNLPKPAEIPTAIQPMANIFGENVVPMYLQKEGNSKIILIGE